MKRFLTKGALALILIATGSTAKAAFDVDFGIGYSRLSIDGKNAKDLDNADGAQANVAFTLKPSPAAAGLRFGFGIEASGYRNDYHQIDPITGDNVHRYHELDLFIPEVRLGYYIPFDHFFIEPSMGVGLAVGTYRVGHVHRWRHDDFEEDDDDRDITRANIALRPKIQIGYARDHWAVGLEASYLWTHLHFDDGIGGDVGELYGGAFFRLSF